MGLTPPGIEALLIDMDGTLVKTTDANFAAYAQALSEAGVIVERESFDARATGRNWRQFLPEMMGEAADRAPEVAARKAELYPEHAGLTEVNTGLVRLIEQLRGTLRVALVTTASEANVETILGHHDLAGLFDLVVHGNHVTRHKPDPEGYVLAAEKLGLAPTQCLIFEDSDIGVAAAEAFGAPCIRVAM